MSIKIERTGLFDTLQDLGRKGFRSFGVPTGGWFDAHHARLANALAGNRLDAPCLEIVLASGRFRTLADLHLAVAGPGSRITTHSPVMGYSHFQNSVVAWFPAGSVVEVEHPDRGLRSYIAVSGGQWAGKAVLGSVSSEKRLQAGEEIPMIALEASHSRNKMVRQLASDMFGPWPEKFEILFVPSREYLRISTDLEAHADGLAHWRMTPQSNRVGLRFEHPRADELRKAWPVEPARLSQPVMPGTIQWTGSELIILGPAGGTMGGYPTLGQVAAADFGQLAQIRPGQEIQLLPSTPDQARLAFVRQEQARSLAYHRILAARC